MAVAPSRLFFTSRLSIVEVVSAFARRVRDNILEVAEFALLQDAFRGDCLNEYQIMPPTMIIIDRACVLLRQYPLRAYDAVQLATALGAQQFLTTQPSDHTLVFLSADDGLNYAAAAEGLVVENPSKQA